MPWPRARVDVDRMLHDPGVDAAAGDGRGGHPAGDLARRGRDEPVAGQPGGGERRPAGRAGLEGGVALVDPGLVDREHGGGVRAGHRLDAHARGRGWHGLRPGRADDRGVHAVPDLMGRGDADAGEPGPGQAVAVLGEGGRPGDAADLAAALRSAGPG